ncbi:hypothetical protein [Methylomarinum vadi]|uniref:hypothetical protein n=1 Tax=Methylomarinum vadi TaxID=438855 RepID=UPI0005649EFB|nr:hypothetical protein [Methylomarinum vadi]
MINLEILITLVAMLVAFFMVVYMLQKGSSWKKRVKRDYETLELAKQLKCDTSKTENLKALGLKPLYIKAEKPNTIKTQCRTAIVFGLIIFCAFLGWSYYLMTLPLVKPAALTMGYALTCVLALLYARNKIEKSKGEREQLREAVAQYEKELAQPAVTQAVAPQRGTRVRLSDAGFNPLEVLYDLARGFTCVPQDSSLKRHYLSKLMAEVESSFGPRPTDSALKRHHDTMLKAEFVRRLEGVSAEPAAKPTAVVAKAAEAVAAQSPVMAIPEDSMLRRHFLSQLRREIEDGFGDRPTDSTLKRHYDAMVDTEYEAQIGALSMLSFKAAERSQIIAAPQKQAIIGNEKETFGHVPEDATLRRHFLSELRAKIVAKLPPKPTDFNLLRHYNALVQAALERELEEHYQ